MMKIFQHMLTKVTIPIINPANPNPKARVPTLRIARISFR